MLLCKSQQAHLVDSANFTRREFDGHVSRKLRYPEPPLLNVDLLPTSGLDVGVGDVIGLESALAGDLASCHFSGADPSSAGTEVQGVGRLSSKKWSSRQLYGSNGSILTRSPIRFAQKLRTFCRPSLGTKVVSSI
jgi:hypothetical protein